MSKEHIIEYAKEETGFDPSYKYNELILKENEDGSFSIFKSDSISDDFIYFYPSQIKQLLNILNNILNKSSQTGKEDTKGDNSKGTPSSISNKE